MVGTWIDDEPIYKQTFNLSSALDVSNTSWTATNISIADNKIKHIIRAETTSSLTSNDNNCFCVNARADAGDTYVMLMAGRSNPISCKYLTLYYIKTAN